MHEASHTSPLIRLVGVSKYYSDGDVHALQNIDLNIDTGESITVVGPSGCGKSTLLNILGALDHPTSGQVFFRDQDLRGADLNRLRSREIGFVFQSFYLLPNLTALENVQLPMFESDLASTARVERARQLLELVGLDNRCHHLPNQLSIGQRQRVAIARALANRPAIILADEPTGSLDSVSGQEVMELLHRLNREENTTLVVVTHDLTIAAQAPRQIQMLDGTIVSDQRSKTRDREIEHG